MAVELLSAGNAEEARLELDAALEQQPTYSTARRLKEQLDTDPRTLLGARSRTYVVQQGETMSVLAERFLGDSLLFYALARYNDLDAPNQLAAGQTLMIPQRAAVAAIPPVTPGGQQAVTAPPPAVVATRGVDPARAGQLRLQALQRLNTGDANGAVVLLRQAQALDSANPAIQRDLDRASRLASLQTAGTN